MKTIKILGPGCAKCQKLHEVVTNVVTKNKLEADIIKIEDMQEILAYDVLVTPVLIIDDKIAVKGRVPMTKEVESLLLA